MVEISENLTILHQREETLRAESLRRICESADLTAHVQLIESALDLIHHLIHAAPHSDPDDRTVRLLGIRLFNGIASALKLLLSGYSQTSALQLRDVIETTFLLDYFTTDRNLITEWRTGEERERRKKFKPVAVRTALDARDKFTGKRRSAAYDQFCQVAAHPNPDGFEMLKLERGGDVAHCGPFLEDGALSALIAESAVCAGQAAEAFRMLIKAKSVADLEAKLAFMEIEAAWLQRFFQIAPDQIDFDEIRALLATVRNRKN